MPRVHVAEIQRNRMLAAAIDAVADVGYPRLTVAQVIARARVSRKTFYDAFADRDECFLAVFDGAVARAEREVRAAYEAAPSWRDGLRAGLARLLELMDDERALARVCVVDALGAGERVQVRRAELLGRLAQTVDRVRPKRSNAREPSPLTAEGVVGGVFAVLYNRLADGGEEPLAPLLGALMSMIVLPYLGARAADRELARPQTPARARETTGRGDAGDPLAGLKMRLTYRTVRVLTVIGEHPEASNREVAERSGIVDQGQVSKLLNRLARLELIANSGGGQERGAANAWNLTARGAQVERAARPR
jgi:AcrR family transcriptional regulator/DNA-binding MarR family transcriptional regulator